MSGTSHSRDRDQRAVAVALTATGAFFCVELVAGFLTNSVALLADAVHMLTDVAALGMSFAAFWLSRRPATATKTYGYHRAEILAALVNGLILWFAVAAILYESYHRLFAPEPVRSEGLLVVAVMGLGVNVFCALQLAPRRQGSLNVRAAFLHVLSDLLGSVGAIAAAVVMLATGWNQADAIAGIAIAVLILVNSWGLIREATDILMEAVPSHIALEGLRQELQELPGTEEIHDLHVWTLTSGTYALSAHAVTDGSVPDDDMLDAMQELLSEKFHIHHVTIQLERRNRRAIELAAHS